MQSPSQKGLTALVHALPSAIWYFPRAGPNASTSWTKTDAVVSTRTKKYSAYDIAEIFTDLGFTATQQSELEFLYVAFWLVLRRFCCVELASRAHSSPPEGGIFSCPRCD